MADGKDRMLAMRQHAYRDITAGANPEHYSTTALWEVARRLQREGRAFLLADVLAELQCRANSEDSGSVVLLRKDVQTKSHETPDEKMQREFALSTRLREKPSECTIEELRAGIDEFYQRMETYSLFSVACELVRRSEARINAALDMDDSETLVIDYAIGTNGQRLPNAALDPVVTALEPVSDTAPAPVEPPISVMQTESDTAPEPPLLSLDATQTPAQMIDALVTAGMTVKAIAAHVGMDNSDMSKVRKGKKAIPAHRLSVLTALYQRECGSGTD